VTADPLRVIVAEDDVLLREGIARILSDAGLDVVAQAGDADTFLRRALAHRPDVVVVDVQMPPGDGDDGLVAAIELRRRLPSTGVLVLSQALSERYALELIRDSAEGVGYLLKYRVGDVETFVDAVARVAAGGSALDPELVTRMVGPRRPSGPVGELTARERDVLASMAEGNSNDGIAAALLISQAAVEKHITSIFSKLGLSPDTSGHRRVQAVLMYLQDEPR
jgi:DNA-binding NarL/FixJ family response regulator